MKVENGSNHLKQGELIAAVGHREMHRASPGGDTDAVTHWFPYGRLFPIKQGCMSYPFLQERTWRSSCLCRGIQSPCSEFLMHFCCSQTTWVLPILLGTCGKGAGWEEGFSERGVTLLGVRKCLECCPHPCLLPAVLADPERTELVGSRIHTPAAAGPVPTEMLKG